MELAIYSQSVEQAWHPFHGRPLLWWLGSLYCPIKQFVKPGVPDVIAFVAGECGEYGEACQIRQYSASVRKDRKQMDAESFKVRLHFVYFGKARLF